MTENRVIGALHLIFSANGYNAARTVVQRGDELVLLGDGVYQLCMLAAEAQGDTIPAGRLTALQADAELRGIAGRLAHGSDLIDNDQLVQLVCDHQPVISWW